MVVEIPHNPLDNYAHTKQNIIFSIKFVATGSCWTARNRADFAKYLSLNVYRAPASMLAPHNPNLRVRAEKTS